MSFLTPALRAVAQLDDPAFLGVIARSILWAIAALAALTACVAWGLRSLAAGHGAAGWVSWLAAAVGGVGTVALALYFFVAIVTVIATLFIDPVARAVEHRFYPGLPPSRPAPLADQVWDGVVLGLRVLVWQVVGLILTLLLPGVGALIGWAIAAWAIGRGLFVAVAMRRMERARAVFLYDRMRLPVIAQGALVAAGSLVPVLNLAMPVLGAAAMVHLLHGARSPGGGSVV